MSHGQGWLDGRTYPPHSQRMGEMSNCMLSPSRRSPSMSKDDHERPLNGPLPQVSPYRTKRSPYRAERPAKQVAPQRSALRVRRTALSDLQSTLHPLVIGNTRWPYRAERPAKSIATPAIGIACRTATNPCGHVPPNSEQLFEPCAGSTSEGADLDRTDPSEG